MVTRCANSQANYMKNSITCLAIKQSFGVTVIFWRFCSVCEAKIGSTNQVKFYRSGQKTRPPRLVVNFSRPRTRQGLENSKPGLGRRNSELSSHRVRLKRRLGLCQRRHRRGHRAGVHVIKLCLLVSDT
jgi:hypothetical protein